MPAKLLSQVRHNLVAYLALFFAWSGTAVARRAADEAGRSGGWRSRRVLPRPDHRAKRRRDERGRRFAHRVRCLRHGRGTLTGADILESSLGKVGDADTLDGRNSTDFLGAAAKAADADQLEGRIRPTSWARPPRRPTPTVRRQGFDLLRSPLGERQR